MTEDNFYDKEIGLAIVKGKLLDSARTLAYIHKLSDNDLAIIFENMAVLLRGNYHARQKGV